jgi:hypothetical protein
MAIASGDGISAAEANAATIAAQKKAAKATSTAAKKQAAVTAGNEAAFKSQKIVDNVNKAIDSLPQNYADIASAITETEDAMKAADDAFAAVEAAKKSSGNFVAPDGTVFQDATAYAAYVGYLGKKENAFDTQKRSSQSAFDLLYAEFANYGLGALVEPLRNMVQEGISGEEFTLRLRETEPYKKRFAANTDRIAKGLTALSEGEYLAKEDAYQNIMRNYGLPESYYAKDSLGTQAGFQKLLANDVSAVELEDRIFQAKDRVLNSNPQVAQALKAYYPGITDGDILGYVLDPKNALKDIQRKVAAAEIGGAALAQGLTAGVTRAEELAGLGVTKAAAQAGYADVAQIAPRGSELASFYGEPAYGQTEAEAEVFNTSGAADAAKKRKKLTALETAKFSGSSGVGALGRDRASNYGSTQSGFGQY